MATANAKLRDATEQLRDVVLHRLRSEARIAEMEKRLTVVKENRRKHAEGRRVQLGGCSKPVSRRYPAGLLQCTALIIARDATGHTSNPGLG